MVATTIGRSIVLLASATLLLSGCAGGSDSGGLGVDVSFDPGMPRSARDQAVRVEVYLIASCDDVSIGERPVASIASTYSLRDGEAGAIGDDFDPGDYGLYAVAQDVNCAVVAAGCSSVTVTADGEGTLAVTLTAFPSEGCPSGQQCVLETGNCSDEGGTGGTGGAGGVGGAGGTGGVIIVDCSVEPDETACSAEGASGLCRSGECCTGCWDGSTCQAGDVPVRCGAGGQLCQLCECFSDACVAGACKPVPSFDDLDIGFEHSCAIAEDGHLWCWGSHEFGELGLGDATGSTCGSAPCFKTPTEMVVLVGGSAPTWSRVSAGEDVTCGIRASDASLWCWGSNANGRMGAADTVASSNEPLMVSAGIYQQVDNEDKSGCALRTDGSLWCWGQNNYGEVGQGYAGNDIYGPLEVPYASDWSDYTMGDQHVCAIQQERVWCWGYNGDGQLGNGETNGTTFPATNGFVGTHIEAGLHTTCALDSFGVGRCWGENFYGQAGTGDTSRDDLVAATPIAGALSFDHFSLGERFSCGVTASGALYCWGRNIYEKLGIGELYGDVQQVEVPTRLGTDSDWAKVSAGQNHACALRTDGSLWCWGNNGVGQLGMGDTTRRIFPTRLCF